MAVGALVVPRFPLACELIERPQLKGRAVAVARHDATVWVASEAAEAVGIAPGQPMREAIARCPTLAVLEGRPGLYQDVMDAILLRLEQATPGVEPGPEGITYLQLKGVQRIYGSTRAMAQVFLDCAPAGLEPRLGMAANKFLARIAAALASPGAYKVIAKDIAAVLEDQPVEVLPVSDEMLRRLRLLGISTLGLLSAVPAASLAAQFGREGELASRLSRGEDDTPLQPRPHLERVVERTAFDPPLINREVLLVAAEQALTRALRQPLAERKSTRQVGLRAEIEHQGFWEKRLTFKEPVADRARIWTAIKPLIDDARLPGPVIELRLELAGLVPDLGWQLSLPLMHKRLQEHLEEALRQLKTNYGYCPVGRIVEVEPWSRIPERRLALIDFDP